MDNDNKGAGVATLPAAFVTTDLVLAASLRSLGYTVRNCTHEGFDRNRNPLGRYEMAPPPNRTAADDSVAFYNKQLAVEPNGFTSNMRQLKNMAIQAAPSDFRRAPQA